MANESGRHSQSKGRVAEWSNAVVLKTTVPQGTVGSNPTPSAVLIISWLRKKKRGLSGASNGALILDGFVCQAMKLGNRILSLKVVFERGPNH